ncbi:MAG: histidine phosphatase family protein [Desulfobulbaceae bacterium]|nr:histidine phosphatase family protein [Desulfobulbaceae bacterium]
MKRLLLCRHGKSSWKDLGLEDFDRPLNKRGKRDAPGMGKILVRREIRPDLIVSSPAKRARKTAQHLARELEYPKKRIVYMGAIYGADPDDLLTCIHSFDDRFDQVIMVGHNPGFTLLANILGNLSIFNVPTCGIVALDFAVAAWQDVGRKEGDLVFFDYPKMLEP